MRVSNEDGNITNSVTAVDSNITNNTGDIDIAMDTEQHYYLFQGKDDSMSNFYGSRMTVTDGTDTFTYPTLEHAYHISLISTGKPSS